MFHQINSNVHNNSINNSNHHNNNLFEEEYSHTVHTACALKYCRVFVSVCLYVCVWVCVTLRKNIFQQISIFLVGAAFTGFLEKSEWEPRENNIRPRKDRERVYFANRPAFLFHPHDFLPFYDDDLNKHQTEREEREERMRASFSKRSRCCSSSSCSSSSSSKFVYCSHFTSLELFFSIPNAVVIFVDFAFHSGSQISPYALGCPRSATKPRMVFSLKNPPARAHKK